MMIKVKEFSSSSVCCEKRN